MKFFYKRHFSFFLCFCLLFAFPYLVSAESTPVFTEGDYEYTVTDGEVTITQYIGKGGEITIPSSLGGVPVTTIGSQSFMGCSDLTNLLFPDSITKIEAAAFYCCSGLKSVIIPDGITIIEESTFLGCQNLTSVVLPKGLVRIENMAFAACTRLKQIEIPDTVAEIGIYAFDAGKRPLGIALNNLTIFTRHNNEAMRYAQKHNIRCVLITDYSTDTMGDINGDGNIDASDALLALQHSVHIVDLRNASLAMADMDQNGSVDALDALQILQHSVFL